MRSPTDYAVERIKELQEAGNRMAVLLSLFHADMLGRAHKEQVDEALEAWKAAGGTYR